MVHVSQVFEEIQETSLLVPYTADLVTHSTTTFPDLFEVKGLPVNELLPGLCDLFFDVHPQFTFSLILTDCLWLYHFKGVVKGNIIINSFFLF